ncbi:uncharacterized protein A4U43_C02F22550 [Asparagus officinalis]|uniref:Uncharacterized protein n=1 Tax=Asparagus officinalis TaxID=4686 RepID=A0A5P1FPA4_ASPOF|nr:uncharacterized protein A4U43_C02F22550 [Asparagus officinalis]
MSVDLRRRRRMRRRMVNVMAKIVKKGKVKHEYPWPHKIEPDPNVKGGILSPSRSLSWIWRRRSWIIDNRGESSQMLSQISSQASQSISDNFLQSAERKNLDELREIREANSHYFVIIEQVSLSVTCDNTEVEICSSDNITPCKRNLFESDVEQSVSVDLISPVIRASHGTSRTVWKVLNASNVKQEIEMWSHSQFSHEQLRTSI